MRKNEDGLAGVIELLLIAVVVGAIGFFGYRVMNSRKDKSSSNPQSSSVTASNTQTAAAGQWMAGGIAVKGTYADADVVKISDTAWRMYYAIQPEVKNNDFEVYSATSTDGKTWKQESGIRKTMATFPDVIKLPDGRYRMFFQNAGLIKSALSNDGLTFTDETGGVQLPKSNTEGLIFDNIAAPTVMRQKDGTYLMVYRGTVNKRYAANTPNPTMQLLLWATSPDGQSFTPQGIAVDSRNDTLAGQLDGPELVAWDDGSIKLFATSYTGVYEFDFKNGKFSQGTLAFAGNARKDQMGFNGQPPGDPTLAYVGKTWYMYYGQTGAKSGIHYATLR